MRNKGIRGGAIKGRRLRTGEQGVMEHTFEPQNGAPEFTPSGEITYQDPPTLSNEIDQARKDGRPVLRTVVETNEG